MQPGPSCLALYIVAVGITWLRCPPHLRGAASHFQTLKWSPASGEVTTTTTWPSEVGESLSADAEFPGHRRWAVLWWWSGGSQVYSFLLCFLAGFASAIYFLWKFRPNSKRVERPEITVDVAAQTASIAVTSESAAQTALFSTSVDTASSPIRPLPASPVAHSPLAARVVVVERTSTGRLSGRRKFFGTTA